MSSRMKNAEELCESLQAVRSNCLLLAWTAPRKRQWVSMLGVIDGKVSPGDAKMHIIKALEGLNKGKTTTADRQKTYNELGRAIAAIDPQWSLSGVKAKAKAPARKRLSPVPLAPTPLQAAYAAAKNMPTVPQLVDAAWPRIERAMIDALNTGRFTTHFHTLEDSNNGIIPTDGVIDLPKDEVSRSAFTAMLAARIPKDLPATVTIMPEFDEFAPTSGFSRHGLKISLAQ